MLTLWATVITLAFLAGVVELQPVIDSLPVQLPVPNVASALQKPPSVPVPNPSGPTGQRPKGQPAGGAGANCPVMAIYMMSAEKLQEYLNRTMPAKIEELVRCSDVKLAGIVGSLLTTVTAGNLLSVLPLDAITNILPLGILDNVLGKGDAAKPKGNADAPEAPALPPVDKEAVARPVFSIFPGAAAAEPVSQLTRQVSSKVNDITGSLQGLLSNGVPDVNSKLNDITGSFGGLLSNGVPGVTSKLNDITGPIQGLLSNGVPGVTSKLNDITGSVGGLLSNGVPGLTSKLNGITGPVQGLLSNGVPGVTSKLNDITGPIQVLLSNGVPGLTSKLNGITGPIQGLLSNGVPGVTSKLNDITGSVGGLLSNGVPGLTSKLNGITGPVQGLLSNGVPGLTSKLSSITGSVGGLLKSVGGKNLGNVVSQVKGLSKVPSDLLGNLLSSDSSKAGDGEALGDKGGLDLSGLLLKLKLGEVNVVKIMYSNANDGVEVQSTVTADVQSDGVAGAVITALGFQVELCVSMIIRSTHDPTNNTVQLEVEQKTMEVTKVTITLVETVTSALPLPLPLPLPVDSVLLMALSVDLTQNAKKSSCVIQFPDFDSGKNVTSQKFHYIIAKTQIIDGNLHVDYCGKGMNDSDWIPGNSLPKHPKNASVSLILADRAVRKQVTACAAPVHCKVGDMDVTITKISYNYPSEDKEHMIVEFQLKKFGEAYGIVMMAAQFDYRSRHENGKMVSDIKYMRTLSENITPPEITDQVTGLLPTMLEKSVSAITECLNKWNLPTGVSSYPVPSSKIVPQKTKDLQMGK